MVFELFNLVRVRVQVLTILVRNGVCFVCFCAIEFGIVYKRNYIFFAPLTSRVENFSQNCERKRRPFLCQIMYETLRVNVLGSTIFLGCFLLCNQVMIILSYFELIAILATISCSGTMRVAQTWTTYSQVVKLLASPLPSCYLRISPLPSLPK